MKILAFPGMGKTPLSLKSGKYLDLDFGHFRESLNVQKDDEQSLLKPFAKLMEMYENDGFVVLSNDPKLMSVTHIDRVYVPQHPRYAAKKLHVSKETIAEWIDDWIDTAIRHSVPVVPLRVGLDHYLLSASKNSTEVSMNAESTNITRISKRNRE